MDRSARRFHWDVFGIFYVELSGSPGSYRPAVPQLNQVGSQGAFVRRYPTIAFVCGRCSAFPFDTAGRRASFFGEIHFLVKKNFWLNLNQFSDPSTYVEGFVLGRSFDKRLADNHLKLGRRHRQFIDWRCCRRVEVVRIMGGLSCEQDVGSRWDASSRCKSSTFLDYFWFYESNNSMASTVSWERKPGFRRVALLSRSCGPESPDIPSQGCLVIPKHTDSTCSRHMSFSSISSFWFFHNYWE